MGLGAHAEAIWFYQEARAIFQDIGNQEGTVAALIGLGNAQLARGEVALAQAAFIEALTIAQRIGSAPRILDAAIGIAAALMSTDARSAAELAALVYAHPAATQACRDRAVLVLDTAGAALPNAIPGTANTTLDVLLQKVEQFTTSGQRGAAR